MFWVGNLQLMKMLIPFTVNMRRKWDSEFDDIIKDGRLKVCSLEESRFAAEKGIDQRSFFVKIIG